MQGAHPSTVYTDRQASVSPRSSKDLPSEAGLWASWTIIWFCFLLGSNRDCKWQHNSNSHRLGSCYESCAELMLIKNQASRDDMASTSSSASSDTQLVSSSTSTSSTSSIEPHCRWNAVGTLRSEPVPAVIEWHTATSTHPVHPLYKYNLFD